MSVNWQIPSKYLKLGIFCLRWNLQIKLSFFQSFAVSKNGKTQRLFVLPCTTRLNINCRTRKCCVINWWLNLQTHHLFILKEATRVRICSVAVRTAAIILNTPLHHAALLLEGNKLLTQNIASSRSFHINNFCKLLFSTHPANLAWVWLILV